MRNYLKNVAFYAKGNYDLMKRILRANERVPHVDTDASFLCIGEGLYPKSLYELKKPPFVIFYEGDIHMLCAPMVAVIGSRTPCAYGVEQTQRIVKQLKTDAVIVSGLARGIDTIAHREALSHQTLGVLGCGINVDYPKSNSELIRNMKQHHCVISEYPPGTEPQKYFFPFRNRILAALSHSIYVMAAQPKSGTMTTVNEALNLNRSIVCLPYRITDMHGQGCNQLIEEGAQILTNAHF